MIKKQQSGFTLIELVVVIVILGILAAFAVPRFMGLETEARVATVKSMGGALRSAAAMAHGNCMAQSCPNASTQLTLNGRLITFVNQYPNRATMPDLIEAANGFTANTANGRFTKDGARTVNCWVQYNQAAAGQAPTIQFRGGILGSAPDQQIEDMLRTDC